MLNNLFKCTGSIIKVLLIKILIEQVQEQRNFNWSLQASGRMNLKKCVWRSASEETSLKKSSWRHIIRSNGHQKHISSKATSPELTKENVRSVLSHHFSEIKAIWLAFDSLFYFTTEHLILREKGKKSSKHPF